MRGRAVASTFHIQLFTSRFQCFSFTCITMLRQKSMSARNDRILQHFIGKMRSKEQIMIYNVCLKFVGV